MDTDSQRRQGAHPAAPGQSRPAGSRSTSTARSDEVSAFLERYGRVVVKPARGEQGGSVFVDLTTEVEVTRAIERARQVCDQVLVEKFVTGQDLRIIVIDGAVVAAAIRKPATVHGDGQHTIRMLIETQTRRRAAATGGESRIPLDGETERAIHSAGYRLDDVLAEGESLAVRKTANLHTGGTIHDVTADLHPDLAAVAVNGARVLEVPVVGFDFLVPDPSGPDYVIIEANERLANHESQPTAERFIDFLFPQSRTDSGAHRQAVERDAHGVDRCLATCSETVTTPEHNESRFFKTRG